MKYPSTVYRVSVKAAIFDGNDRILLVKEHSEELSLPGGGLEHYESIRENLTRELKEEISEDVEIVSISRSPLFAWTAYPEDVPKMSIAYLVDIKPPEVSTRDRTFAYYPINEETLDLVEEPSRGFLRFWMDK